MPTSKHSLFTEATAQPIDLLWIDGELRELTLVKYNYHNTLLSKYWILDPFYPCRRQALQERRLGHKNFWDTPT